MIIYETFCVKVPVHKRIPPVDRNVVDPHWLNFSFRGVSYMRRIFKSNCEFVLGEEVSCNILFGFTL